MSDKDKNEEDQLKMTTKAVFLSQNVKYILKMFILAHYAV